MTNKLIIALGNPGKQFEHTRHNLGQDVIIDWVAFVQQQGAEVGAIQSKESLHARVQEILFNNTKITVLFPDLFMNDSGKAVMQYLRYNEIDHENILIIHDDLELPVGEVRLLESGSAKGHNGVRSIHEFVGTLDIPRLRIGIGRPADARPIEKFVLEKFTPEEKSILGNQLSSILNKISEVVLA